MSVETSKLKMLYLIRMFEECTDENHGLTMPQIIQKLAELGISAERKALYRDIKALNQFGLHIEKARCAPVEYRMTSRLLPYSELQLLADAVQGSRFLTKSSSDRLLRSLKTLCSKQQAKTLGRRLHVGDRVKMQNESVFRNIDVINEAIHQKKKVGFLYFKYDCDKEPVFQHDGDPYRETPIHLVFSDGFYYLIAYNDNHDDFVTYRIDRMKAPQVLDEKAVRNDATAAFDIAEYEKRAFGMYKGEPVSVTLVVAEEAMGGVIDRFGREVVSVNRGDGTAEVHVSVMESNSFFGWLVQFGTLVRIEEPSSMAQRYKDYLLSIAQAY